jgi:hypothetical protein
MLVTANISTPVAAQIEVSRFHGGQHPKRRQGTLGRSPSPPARARPRHVAPDQEAGLVRGVEALAIERVLIRSHRGRGELWSIRDYVQRGPRRDES